MNNKDSFNDVDPSDNVWKGINKKLRKNNGFLQVAWKVAAVIFMVSTVYLLIEKNLQESQVGTQFSEEFKQAEDYYTQLISLKRIQIQEELSPEEQGELLKEIDQLDALYIDLKKTYQTQAADDRVLDAMVSNLQLRLQILSKQLNILENIKDQNDEIEANIEI
ncbi:MAG: hypothetical protein ABJG78_17500 [Cyclobacteriaceae bacterium]